jgi:hypothetical protein
MTKYQKNLKKAQSISIYFGMRHQNTLNNLDNLALQLKTSRTGTINFLLLHYKWFDRHRPFLTENET